MKEYKVLTQGNGLLNGKFKPEKLEVVLNNLAAQDWLVVSASTAQTRPGLGKMRQEIVVILERSAK